MKKVNVILLSIIISFFNLNLLSVQSSGAELQRNEIQRNIDTQYRDMLRQQEMENRTKFIREDKSSAIVPEQPRPSRQKRLFKKIEIIHSNAAKISDKDLEKITAPYKDNMVGMNEIAAMQEQIQALYINSGYVTSRIYIDGNTMPDGALTFVVVDGYIEDITFKNGKGKEYSKFATALQKFTFYPFAGDSILNIKNIDQGLEQINRLGSSNATMNVLPGTKDGYSVIEVTNDASKRFYISLSADNSGMENTGVYKANSAINSDNLLMLNDNIYFNYSRNIDGNWDNKRNNSYFASLSIPFGFFTFMSSYFYSDYNTVAGSSQGSRYVSDGSTQNSNASLEMIIKRSQNYKVSAGAEMALKETANYAEGSKISLSSKNLTVASAFLTTTQYFVSGSMIYGKLSYNRGLNWFDAVENYPSEYDLPKGQFYSVSLFAQYSVPFKIPLVKLGSSYSLTANGQYSPDILYGSEQISIGGQSSVRGFKEGSVGGEGGFYLKNDLYWSLSDIFRRAGYFNLLVNTSLNAFVDYGYANDKAAREIYQLAGGGAGLSYRMKYFNASAVWSKAIYNDSYLEDEGNIFYLNVGCRIYF